MRRYDGPMQIADPIASSWQALLDLGFERRGDGTVLARRAHHGPLRIQKPLYPEGADVCHALVLHPPSGIVGGDHLDIRASADAGAHALLTTPGAGKWYRSAGAHAVQELSVNVAANAVVEWLPQESILFSGALAEIRNRINVAAGGLYLGLDTLCFGRRASGERFDNGALRLATDIHLDGRLLWRERGDIAGASPLLTSPVGMAGHAVCSTLLVAGREIAPDLLAAARAAVEVHGVQQGITVLPHLLVARWLGDSTEAARAWFLNLWRVLRPALIAREAVTPRIWNT